MQPGPATVLDGNFTGRIECYKCHKRNVIMTMPLCHKESDYGFGRCDFDVNSYRYTCLSPNKATHVSPSDTEQCSISDTVHWSMLSNRSAEQDFRCGTLCSFLSVSDRASILWVCVCDSHTLILSNHFLNHENHVSNH